VNHRQVSLEENPPQRFAESAETPEQRYARAERRRLLSRTVEELEPSLRAAIALRYGDELSNAEIGRRLNLSVPAVKSRLMRARMRLRQQLGQHLDRAAARHGRRKGVIEFRRPRVARPELRAAAPFPAAAGATGTPGDVFILRRAA
jgi:predicted RNA polymerase sigma factor